MSFKRTLNIACVAIALPILWVESVLGAGPILTGRWGAPKLPQELACEFPGRKTEALAVVTFSCHCPLARRLMPQLNELRDEFEQPIRLRSGDAIYSVAHFDNSSYNPHNPDSEAFVKYGLRSDDEMLHMRVKYERTSFAEPASVGDARHSATSHSGLLSSNP